MSPTTLRLACSLLTLSVVGLGTAVPAAAHEADAATAPAIETLELPSAGSPLVAVRALFTVGSAHDPEGKEGLAALTALMVGESGTARRSYAELVDALYPLAASIESRIDREVSVFYGEVHRDTLERYTELFAEALTAPGFDAADFERNKNQLRAYLTETLRGSNDELLGHEVLQQELFAGHPYGHAPAGTVAGLEAITLDDVREFYRRHYTRGQLLLGVAGGYPAGYPRELARRLGELPAGEAGRLPLPPPPEVEGRRFTLIDKETGSVGIHFGHPLPVTRADAAYYPLMVANSYLGEHRTFHGRLMQQLRAERGLNYGDYSYIEHYYLPPFTQRPTPNVPRRQQYFSIWIRPVVPDNAHFALRAALHELDRLRERGLTREEFELTRDFLVNFSKLWAQTLSDRLGFALDSRLYDMPYFIDHIEERLAELTVEEVNAAVREHLASDRYRAVLVTDDARALAAALFTDEPSPIEYNSEVPEEVLEADREIVPRPVEPTAVEVVPVAEVFER